MKLVPVTLGLYCVRWNNFLARSCLGGWRYSSPLVIALVLTVMLLVNPLPDNKISDWSKLKQIADNILTHFQTMTPFDAPWKQAFENTLGKGEIARNEQFLLCPVFSTRLDNFLPFLSNLKLLSANSFSLEESKICHLVMG